MAVADTLAYALTEADDAFGDNLDKLFEAETAAASGIAVAGHQDVTQHQAIMVAITIAAAASRR